MKIWYQHNQCILSFKTKWIWHYSLPIAQSEVNVQVTATKNLALFRSIDWFAIFFCLKLFFWDFLLKLIFQINFSTFWDMSLYWSNIIDNKQITIAIIKFTHCWMRRKIKLQKYFVINMLLIMCSIVIRKNDLYVISHYH